MQAVFRVAPENVDLLVPDRFTVLTAEEEGRTLATLVVGAVRCRRRRGRG